MAVIGIVLKYSRIEDGRCILYLGECIRRCIQKAGGFVLPIVQVQDVDYCDTRYNEYNPLTDSEKREIDKYLDMCDGVIFPGGFKTTPYDKYVLNRCIELDKKTLGICLGMQMMSCHKSDFLVYKNENINMHFQENDNKLSHVVKIDKNSKLYDILKKDEIEVNSFHKMHVGDDVGDYKIISRSSDGLVEGIEHPNCTFNVGIQWHPEISYDFDDNSKKIIDYFIKICEK